MMKLSDSASERENKMLQFLKSLLLAIFYPPIFLIKGGVKEQRHDVSKWESRLFAPWHNLRSQFDDVDHYNEFHWVIRAFVTAVYWFLVYQVFAVIF